MRFGSSMSAMIIITVSPDVHKTADRPLQDSVNEQHKNCSLLSAMRLTLESALFSLTQEDVESY